MKISNHKLTQCIGYLLLIAVLCSIILILINKDIVLDIVLVILSISFFFIFTRLQCIIYENSGNCVTFRKHHPFSLKKFIPPFIELPQSSIKDFNFNNNLGITKLTLRLNSKRRKNTVLRMFLLGFTNSQRKKVASSLQTIRLNNENQLFR